jgi:hypothetical protein
MMMCVYNLDQSAYIMQIDQIRIANLPKDAYSFIINGRQICIMQEPGRHAPVRGSYEPPPSPLLVLLVF